MSKNRFVSFGSQILKWNRPEGLTQIYFTLELELEIKTTRIYQMT